MTLCHENMPQHPMLSGVGGRPSPTFFNAYGHSFMSAPGGQPGGLSGVSGHMGPYGGAGHPGSMEHGQYPQYHHIGYDSASPPLQAPPSQQPPTSQQQQQPGVAEDSNPIQSSHSAAGQSWHYTHVGPMPQHPRPAHIEDWGQHYLPIPNQSQTGSGIVVGGGGRGDGTTPPLQQHPSHQSPYGYPGYRVAPGLDYDPLGGGMDTSSSTESNSPPGGTNGGGPGGGTGTKQLRAPFEWMKPANVQPAPGKTRTKDKYRVVYSDHQRLELEKEFHFSRYITIRRKAEIAEQLALSERQVKIWFQNRRAKERKQNKKREENARSSGSIPKLEPLDSPPPITAQHHPQSHAHSPNMSMHMNPHQMMGHSGDGGMSHQISMSSLPIHGYASQRISPASAHGLVLDNQSLAPQTSNTNGSAVPQSEHCSHQSQNITTPTFEEKHEPA